MPSHYLNQWCIIVSWTLRNKPQWNLNQNSHVFIQEMHLKNVVWKLAAIFASASTYARRQVISYVTKASACKHTFHTHHWHRLLEILPISFVNDNIASVSKVHRFIVNMFYYGRIVLTRFEIANIKGVTASVTTGIVGRQFPSLRGITWRSNGSNTQNDSRFEHHICLLSGKYWHSRGESKNIILLS